jgi:ribonuclease-3
MTTLAQFQATLGYHFQDPALLQRALTHRSFINESPDEALEDNERLEILGDAVIDLAVTEMLYHRYPEMREGRITSMRAALVRTETLGRLASYLSVADVLRLGRGEEEHGGNNRPAILCATLEALVGAIYLEGGLQVIRSVFDRHLVPAADAILARDLDRDAKSTFQEWSQAALGHTPRYATVEETGPDHNKTFTVQVLVDDVVCGEGRGRSKQTAAQAAARDALVRRTRDT